MAEGNYPSPFPEALLSEIRGSFCYVDEDPIAGKRIFFENGGGSLVLKTAAQRAYELSRFPDSSRRDNATSNHVLGVIDDGLRHVRTIFGARSGNIMVGMAGTDALFRIARTVLVSSQPGTVVSSALEHASSHDSAQYWAERTGHVFVEVPVDTRTGSLTVDDYMSCVAPDTRMATIIHTSHVTGKIIDVATLCRRIRTVAPDCFIVIDGIQHAPHGVIDVERYGADAYVFSPYKAFSVRGHSFAWLSDRIAQLPHEKLNGKPASVWDIGSRGAAMYAATSAVHDYLCWVGSHFTRSDDTRAQIVAAMEAALAQERHLINFALRGDETVKGLLDLNRVKVLGAADLDDREGAVSFAIDGIESGDVVRMLGERQIRVHYRGSAPDSSAKYVMKAYGMDACVRVSLAHYNSEWEIKQLLHAVADISQ